MPKAASKKYRRNINLLFAVIILILLTLSVNNLVTFQENLKTNNDTVVLGEETVSDEVQISFWKDYVQDNPSYIYGWLALAKLEYKTGGFDLAKLYLEKARQIDPNSLEVLYFRFE